MKIEEHLTARRFTPADRVPGRVVTHIEIHHWGLPGQTHDAVNRFFTDTADTSAHYVASAGRVTCLVSPDDVAYHAGDWLWNLRTVGIECRPEATDGDYQTVAELIRYLRGIYGDIPLIPHRSTYNTACPGVWDLERLDRMARATTTTTTDIEDEVMGYYRDRADFEGHQLRIAKLAAAEVLEANKPDSAATIAKAVWDYMTMAGDGKSRVPMHRALRDPLNLLTSWGKSK